MAQVVVTSASASAKDLSESAAIVRQREVHAADRVFYYLLKFMAWSVVALLAAMIGLVLVMSWPAFKHFGWHFFFNPEWNNFTANFGALAFIFGTMVTSLVALVLAVPVAVGVALFLSELAPYWLAQPIGFLVEMLAAIPSIVYGLWGLFVMAPWLRTVVQPFLAQHFGFLPIFSGPPLGVGLMAAGMVLGIMITPTIAAICREVFRAIPRSHREAALGLGATRWETIRISVLKAGLSGIIGAVILGLGRALGETMAVTMLIGNKSEIHWSLFEAGQTMASLLANQYAEADNDLHLSALTAVGFTLFAVSLLINSVARFVVWRVERNFKGIVR